MNLYELLDQADNYLTDWFIKLSLAPSFADELSSYALFLISIIISIGLFYLTRWILRTYLVKYIRKSDTHWDDYLLEHRIFHKASYLIPAIFIGMAIAPIFNDFEETKKTLFLLVKIFKLLIAANIVNGILNALVNIYNDQSASKKLPVKGITQIIKLIVWIVTIIIVIGIIIEKDPTTILAGLGAISAILLLVFKDTILGFVGGIQLAAFDMVKEGDWISLPKYDADGTVMDISISTVKIKNWDNTISTVPTYSLISESVKNWRGMEESDGRRIKRAVILDAHSVKFCTPEMLERFSKFEYLGDYIKETEERIQKHNEERKLDTSLLINGLRQTNIGVFRAYLIKYLENHPLINHNMTTMVRQLAPTEKGIPMEIYVFSRVKVWVDYEGIQSDIFDHIFAVVPEFELFVFQEPSGADFRKIFK